MITESNLLDKENENKNSHRSQTSKKEKSNEDFNKKKGNITKNIGQFILGEKLGEGTFGVVRIGTHILTGEKVAVKILEKVRILEQADKARVEREIKILKCLRHNNIIQLYSVIQTVSTIYLIMEYASGKELFDYIVLKKRLPEFEACKFYQQILSGVEYLHKLRIVHRDLKPENLLLDHKKDLKIADFGLSNLYKKGELLKTACGSPCYAAPEMIAGKKYQAVNVDVWSTGIILYAMICGYLPFEDATNDILYKKITDGKFNIPGFVSESARDLIKKILTTDPNKRYTIPEIKAHPWFNSLNPDVNINDGLLINIYVIPIDEGLIKKMEEYEFKREEIRINLLSNKHNHITSTYYLLLKSKNRKGITSVSDLISQEFRDYINDYSNLLSAYNNDFNAILLDRTKTKKILNEDYSAAQVINVSSNPKIKENESNKSLKKDDIKKDENFLRVLSSKRIQLHPEDNVVINSNEIDDEENDIKENKNKSKKSSKKKNTKTVSKISDNTRDEKRFKTVKIEQNAKKIDEKKNSNIYLNENKMENNEIIKNDFNSKTIQTNIVKINFDSTNISPIHGYLTVDSVDQMNNKNNIDKSMNEIYQKIPDKKENVIEEIISSNKENIIKKEIETKNKFTKIKNDSQKTKINNIKTVKKNIPIKNTKKNFFDTSMSFDQNEDKKNSTFDSEILNKSLEKNPNNLKANNRRPHSVCSNENNIDKQKDKFYLENKAINKNFHSIREEDEYKANNYINKTKFSDKFKQDKKRSRLSSSTDKNTSMVSNRTQIQKNNTNYITNPINSKKENNFKAIAVFKSDIKNKYGTTINPNKPKSKSVKTKHELQNKFKKIIENKMPISKESIIKTNKLKKSITPINDYLTNKTVVNKSESNLEKECSKEGKTLFK